MTVTSSAPTRPSRRPYGNELAENFGTEGAPFIVTRSLPHAELAVTEIEVVRPFGSTSTPLPRQDAYMVSFSLEDLFGIQYWEDGRPVPPGNVRAGGATFHDLRREPVVLVDRPLHTVQWFVPRAALNSLADEAKAPHINDLRHEPGVGVFDEAIGHMSMTLLSALRAGEQVNRIFVDHITMAFAAHLAGVYGGMEPAARLIKGGLAPWQDRRAKEILVADLTGATPLAEIATACGLGAGSFARAFRRSTGLAPHAWLLTARVDRAMTLLRQPQMPLSEIALACGFADQSHFTRVFTRQTGRSPGVWRRLSIP